MYDLVLYLVSGYLCVHVLSIQSRSRWMGIKSGCYVKKLTNVQNHGLEHENVLARHFAFLFILKVVKKNWLS